MEMVSRSFEIAALFVEGAGVLIIVVGAVFAMWRYIFSMHGRSDSTRSYRTLRHELGKAMLLGLEFLIAADIITTVVTEPQMDRVLALGLIVLIRTFLTLSLQVELDGKFPWESKTH